MARGLERQNHGAKKKSLGATEKQTPAAHAGDEFFLAADENPRRERSGRAVGKLDRNSLRARKQIADAGNRSRLEAGERKIGCISAQAGNGAGPGGKRESSAPLAAGAGMDSSARSEREPEEIDSAFARELKTGGERDPEAAARHSRGTREKPAQKKNPCEKNKSSAPETQWRQKSDRE